MPAGTGTVSPSTQSPGGVAANIIVCLYDDNPNITSNFYKILPNVECIGIQFKKGADPGVARFRYQMGDSINLSWPDRIEDIFGLNSWTSNSYVVQNDAELVVLQVEPNASGMPGDVGFTVLFHGFAQVPQVNASEKTETVTFQAVGVACVLWQNPVAGAIYRNGPDTTVSTNTILKIANNPTDRPTRFNPEGKFNTRGNGNAVVQANWAQGTDTPPSLYPVFLDPTYMGGSPTFLEPWTISSACRYLLYNYNTPINPDDFAGNAPFQDIVNPNFDMMTKILDSQDDPLGIAGVVLEPIPVEDYDATGDPMPIALEKLINPYKRDYFFDLSQDNYGRPVTSIVFYRTDSSGGTMPKDVFLAREGTTYDPSTSNASVISIVRSVDSIVNNVIIDTEMVRYECSFILTPNFTPSTLDYVSPTRDDFTIGNPAFTGDNINAYRLLVFDEAGEGHWAYGKGGNGGAMSTTIPSLDDLLGSPIQNGFGNPPIPQYANHRRPGLGPLFTRDDLGDPLQPQLWVSINYNGNMPGIWDGTGDWQRVNQGGWEILKDQLGIRITTEKVYDWNIGKVSGWTGAGTPPSPGGNIDLTKLLGGNVTTGTSRLAFRLTCVVESDEDMGITSNDQAASTTTRLITRRIDCRDRFKKHIIAPQSSLAISDVDVTDRDDTIEAQDYADAIVHAHACGPISGTITIPHLTQVYSIGDPIRSIAGRNVSFQVNQGVQGGNPVEYPYIIGVDYSFENEEMTHIHFHSDNTEVPLRRRR